MPRMGGRCFVIANAEIVGNELVIGSRSSIGAGRGGRHLLRAQRHDTVIGDAGRDRRPDHDPDRHPGRAEREIWDGSPGRKVGRWSNTRPTCRPPPRPSVAPAAPPSAAAYYRSARASIPAVGLLPIFPAFFIFDADLGFDYLRRGTDVDYHWYLPILTWPTAMLMTADAAVHADRRHPLDRAAPRDPLGHLLGAQLAVLPAQVDRWRSPSEVTLETLSHPCSPRSTCGRGTG